MIDVVLDFKLRLLQPSGPAGEQVWLVSSSLGQMIGQNWWLCPSLVTEVDLAKPWQEGGCRIVFLPWCEYSHYFALVAILDPQPLLYILESIGKYKEPKGAEILRSFLTEQRVLAGGPNVPFVTHSPSVPRQDVGSNDCGLFLLEYALEITSDPDLFVERASTGDISSWFPQERVRTRREDLARLMQNLGEEQRLPGGVLEGEAPLSLPNLFSNEVCLEAAYINY